MPAGLEPLPLVPEGPESAKPPPRPSLAHDRVQSLFGDEESFYSALGPEAGDRIRSQVGNQPDPLRERQRIANTVFLADRAGLTPQEVASHYDTLRQQYAKQIFPDLPATADEGVFFSAVKNRLREEQDQYELQGEMNFELFEAAARGSDFATAWSGMMAKRPPGVSAVLTDVYNAWAIDRWQKNQATVARLSPAVASVAELMVNNRERSGAVGSDEAAGRWDDALDGLMELDADERRTVMTLAARRAQAVPQGDRDALAKANTTFIRGSYDLITSALMGLYNTATGAVAGYVPPKNNRLEVERDLSRAISSEVDPITSDWFAGKVALDFTRSVPLMLAALTPAGLAADFFALKQNARDNLEAQGVPGTTAESVATVQAVPQTALFFATSKMVFLGKLPAGVGTSIPATLAIEYTANLGLNEAGFLTDAGIQQVAALMTEAVPDVDWLEFGRAMIDRAPQQLAMAIPGALIGTGVATFKNRAAGTKYLQNPELMDSLGFTPEAKEAVLAAPDYAAAEQAFKEGYKTRTTPQPEVNPSTDPFAAAITRNPDGTFRVQAVDGAPAVQAVTPEGAVMVEQAQKAEAAQQTATAPPEPRPEQDGRMLPPRVTALNKAEINALRVLFNMDELDAPTRERFQQVLDEAKRTDGARGALEIAHDLIATKRVSSAAEHAALVLRSVELQNAYEAKAAELGDAFAAGDTERAAVLRRVADGLLSELDTVTEASDLTGTSIARALSIRRMRLNRDDYTLARLVQRANAAREAATAPEQQAELKAFSDELAAANRTIEEQKAALAANAVELAKQQAETFVAEGRARRRSATAADARTRRAALKNELAALGYRLNDITNVVGLSADAARIIAKIADTYIEEGVASLTELTNKLKADIPDLSDQDIYTAVGRQTKAEAKKIETEAKQRVKELRSQAALWSKINAALEGKREDGMPLNRTQQNKLLRESLAQLRRQANRTTFDDAALRRIDAKIAEIQNHLATGSRPAPVPEAGENPALTKAKRVLDELRQEMGAIDTITELEAALADAQPKTDAEGKKVVTAPTEQQAKLNALRERIAELRDQIDTAQVDPAAVNADRLARLQRLAAELETHIEEGTRPQRAQRGGVPDDDAVAAARRQVHELEQLMRTEDAIKDLEQQITTGDFKVSAPEQRILSNAKLEAALIRRRQLRRQVDEYIEQLRKKSPRERVVEALLIPRTLLATADMSATLRQGLLLSSSRPVTAARTFVASFRAFLNENTADAIALAVESRPLAMEGAKAKLYLSEAGGLPSAREEHFIGSYAERIPGLGRLVRASNRSMVTTLNLLRVAAFDSFVQAHPDSTPLQRRAYAEYVNAASGRGNVRWSPSTVRTLNAVFFAPRYAVSRFQALYSPFRNFNDPIVRNAILRDFGALLGTGMTVLSLAALAGAEVSIDPSESDFGRIVIDDTRIDIWGGLQQPVRLLAQAALLVPQRAELVELERDIDLLDAGLRFLSYKLSPAVTVPLAVASGENIIGQEQEIDETLLRSIVPLGLQEAWDVGHETESAGAAAGALGASFLGIGVQQHEKR